MSIDIDDFIKICDKVNIIDIRSNNLYNDGHIKNAVNMNPNELLINPSKYIDLYKRYYIYCETGNGSMKVCDYLNKMGYEVININGGFESYLKWNLK